MHYILIHKHFFYLLICLENKFFYLLLFHLLSFYFYQYIPQNKTLHFLIVKNLIDIIVQYHQPPKSIFLCSKYLVVRSTIFLTHFLNHHSFFSPNHNLSYFISSHTTESTYLVQTLPAPKADSYIPVEVIPSVHPTAYRTPVLEKHSDQLEPSLRK